MKSARLETPLGTLALAWEEEGLVRLDLNLELDLALDMELIDAGEFDDPVPTAIREALAGYFRHGAIGLDLPLAPRGTDFQRRVWHALRAIAPGATRTYGDLARELGTSARAIGGACRANPCLIAVPCHRVVAKDGLGGFAGDISGRRLEVKRWLLRHESATATYLGGVEG